jgi:hypothetical protein
MARLPIPGQDKNTWGGILNEFLEVSHLGDGTLAPNTVGATQLAPNSVTSTALADNSVTAANIADGSVTETQLSTGVQTSLGKADSALQSNASVSGDLSGTLSNPTVAKINGVTVSGQAANGTALIATSSNAATWTASATIDTTDLPQPLGLASPGTGTNGAAPNDHVHAMPSLSQLTDQDVSNLADGTIPTWSVSAGKFKQQIPTLSAGSQPLWQTLTSGMTTLPRLHQDDSGSYGSTPSTGTEHFTYFRADKSMTVGHIQFQTGGNAAASSTYAAVGLYTISAGTLTLVASCTNKTTFSGTYAQQSCALTASYAITAGTIYAVGILQVATTPASLLGAWFNGAYMNSAPLLAGTKSSQASLASSTSSLSNQQFPIYYELVA